MATLLRDTASIHLIADICDAIAAALESDPETCHLASTFVALTAQADELSNEKRHLERDSRRTRARLLVADARWDGEVAAFGRAVVDASSGNRKAPTYLRFFKQSAPSVAQSFGYKREVALGRQWITELGRDPAEPLATSFTARLEAVTDRLDQAVEMRARSVAALQAHRTSVTLLLDIVNRELSLTEGALLRLFPTDRARVASYLLASRSSKSDIEEANETWREG